MFPSQQRRGIAQKLTAHGLDLVDKAGADIYIFESSPVAKTLYERNGFEVLEEVELLKGCFMTAMLRRGSVRKAAQ